eukprot:GHVU01048926.1.p1 GENE.GHVU01048926.1~~GHVU01048926.1.p1  ORF type:complete len:103 (-),score=11.65 GHVU01048926.1:50-358(-)
MVGTAYTAEFAATGFAAHMATPILRDNHSSDMTEEEARKLLERCLHVCYYRDTLAYPKVQFATVTTDGINIDQPKTLSQQRWNFHGWTRSTLSIGDIAGNAW